MTTSNLNGPNLPLSSKAERWVKRVLAKEAELLVSQFLNRIGKVVVAVPEGWKSEGLDGITLAA
jgi:hypothetical protein